MDIKIIRAFLGGDQVSYNFETRTFDVDSVISKLASWVFGTRSTTLESPNALLRETPTKYSFLIQIRDAYEHRDTPQHLEWIRESDRLVTCLEEIDNPTLAYTLSKIKQAQNIYKQEHPSLEINTPRFLLNDPDYLLAAVTQNGQALQ